LFEKVVDKAPDLPLAIYGNGWQKNGNESTQQQTDSNYTLDKKILFNLNFIKEQGVIPYLRKTKYRNIDSELSSALITKTHGSPAFEDYNVLTAESMITLGVSRYPSFRFPLLKPDSYSRLRDIEAPMLGACYLTEWTEGIDELYDIENEIAVYRTVEELIEKAKELQADIGKRKKIKINGQKRALADHTIPQSLNKIKCSLGL
jgi:hypothetical protein